MTKDRDRDERMREPANDGAGSPAPDRSTGGSRSAPGTGADAHPDEPGAYIGREPERVADTIPGGVRPGDERIAAYGSAPGPVKDDDATPSGHREGRNAGDDLVREAGQDR